VYTFNKECLNQKNTSDLKKILQYRERLLGAERTIAVTDYGAGSRVFKTNERRICDIAKHAGATTKRMQLLQRVVAYLKPEHILEIGTSVGMATCALALGDSQASVTSLEGCPATLDIARENLDHFKINNVVLVEGRFRESIKNLLPYKLDVIYFDGNHSQQATLDYAHSLLPTAINGTVWIFDDIHWSKEMTQAWEAIKAMPEISVTIDCYHLGFAFFRNEQVKEDFYVHIH
jgi:predicted O-methyltransferase YrrM